jgi:hypothetical protein
MGQLHHAAQTINAGCDRISACVQAGDPAPAVLAVIEQHRTDALRSLGLGVPPGRPADIYQPARALWP